MNIIKRAREVLDIEAEAYYSISEVNEFKINLT